MIKLKCLILGSLFSIPVLPGKAQQFGGNPASVKWKQVNTATVRVIFPNGPDSQANRMANVMKLLGDSTAGTIGGRQKKWDIILQYQTTIPNAYVRMAPVMSELYMTPPQDNFSTGSIRWDDNLIIHENRHIQQFSNFNKGFTRVFSFLLGQEGQLLANGLTVPDYFFEGDAVWQETLVTAQGRGRMPSFYNGFKSLWRADKNYSWMKLRNGSYKDFIPDHYALGYQLVAYGYEKYGPDFWNKVTSDAVRFKAVFYPFNRAVERYSGKSYKQFRKDALQEFKDRTLYPGENDVTAFNERSNVQKDNVVDYLFANYINEDSILVTKRSYREIPAFYIISNGKEKKVRVRDIGIDDYYSYKNGKVVYAAYQPDARWGNRDYSIIRILDIYSGRQKQITFRSKYFSPDIHADGTEILAVSVQTDGTNNLARIDTKTGMLTHKVPNQNNYLYTQTRYINSNTAVSAVRDPGGKMALVKVDLENGFSELLTPFSFNVIGYPAVNGDTVYFNAMQYNADKIFAVTLSDKKIYQVTNHGHGVYYPAVNQKGQLAVSGFTANGYRLYSVQVTNSPWRELTPDQLTKVADHLFTPPGKSTGTGILNDFNEKSPGSHAVTGYRRSSRLFNFHSWRPVAEDPEYGYTFFSDNVLSSFTNTIGYTFNRSDKSHTVGFSSAFGGWFPVLSLGAEGSFNRSVDTAIGKQVHFNAATINAGFSIPLRFVGGRTSQFVQFGAGYNLEQYYYTGVGKNVFSNRAIKYMNAFLSFSNISQQARQHINPRWAQSVSFNYRDAFNFMPSYKFVAHASFYFPGLFPNHSLVLNTAFQKRDSLPDLFSKVFSYSRGYEALSTRQMFKWGANYHFPVVYPDWGFANLLFFQRIRANAFYDHTTARARVNNLLTDIQNRSTGAEIYFDTKWWNAFPVSFGFRFSHLLDTDLLNPQVKNRWEILLPISLVPE